MVINNISLTSNVDTIALSENLTSISYLEKNYEMCQLARKHYFGENLGNKCTKLVVNKLKMLLQD